MRRRGGSAPELRVDREALLPAMGLQQRKVMDRVGGYKDQLAGPGGLNSEAEVACKTGKPPNLPWGSELRVGPGQQAQLQGLEPCACCGGLTFKLAVTRALVVVCHARFFRKDQRLAMLNHMAQVGSHRHGVVRGAGRLVQRHQREGLVQDVNAKLRQALRGGIGMR